MFSSFDDGFNFGFEDTCHPDFVTPQASGSDYLALDGAPFSTQNQLHNIGKPSDNLRISAIEILSSGSLFGLKKDKQLTLATIVPEEGLRASREILPSKILINTYDTTIHPSGENSIWKSNTLDYNTSENTEYITSLLRDSDPNNNTFIELHSTSSVADSGKLKLKFSHEAPTFSFQRHGGAFAFGNRQGGLQTAQELQIADSDSFFIVDEIELSIEEYLSKFKKEGSLYSRTFTGELSNMRWSKDRKIVNLNELNISKKKRNRFQKRINKEIDKQFNSGNKAQIKLRLQNMIAFLSSRNDINILNGSVDEKHFSTYSFNVEFSEDQIFSNTGYKLINELK